MTVLRPFLLRDAHSRRMSFRRSLLDPLLKVLRLVSMITNDSVTFKPFLKFGRDSISSLQILTPFLWFSLSSLLSKQTTPALCAVMCLVLSRVGFWSLSGGREGLCTFEI